LPTENSEKEVLSRTKKSEFKKQKRNKTKKNEENEYLSFTKMYEPESKLKISQKL
jgi:hypothetical protein